MQVDPIRLRKRALQCRMLAATALTDDGRRVLFEMADYYDAAANREDVFQLLVRERMQVWPYLVVLVVAFILFQPLCNRIVGMHRDA